VLGVLLLALGAAGLASAKGSAEHGSGPASAQWWLFAAAAVAAGLSAFVRLRRLIADSEPRSTAEGRLHRGALAMVAVATAAVPIALFLVHGHLAGHGGALCTTCPVVMETATQGVNTPLPVTPTKTAHATAVKLPLGPILLILGAILAVLVAAALAVMLLRWWAGRGETAALDGAPLPSGGEDEQDASALGMAVLAGRDALEGEARAAIISCYAAMENSLAEAGVPRLESDSPADLLARAAGRGVLDGPAPGLLAALFREARFSTHPLDARHLNQARGALDEIAAQLAARRTADAKADRTETAEPARDAAEAQAAGKTTAAGSAPDGTGADAR
jgi:hypothetical protein